MGMIGFHGCTAATRRQIEKLIKILKGVVMCVAPCWRRMRKKRDGGGEEITAGQQGNESSQRLNVNRFLYQKGEEAKNLLILVGVQQQQLKEAV